MQPPPPSEGTPRRLYVNAVRASGGGYDVVLELGFKPHSDAEPEALAEVIMSWEHAKSMIPLLQRLVETFEEEVGPVPRAPLKMEVEQ